MSENPESVARETFQVDLRGMVDVLSHHLYSSPTVFVRELLQNAVDAIHARRSSPPHFVGEVLFEVTPSTRTITVTDDGIGLSRDQIADFVSRVGASSKRAAAGEELSEFIGQFGIGLLSCFMVADEVIVLTRSAEPNSPSLEWKACADGTYTIRTLETQLEIGTRVVLQLRPDAAEYAEHARLSGLAKRYGQYLREDVIVEDTGKERSEAYTSGCDPLWELDDDDEWRLEYAREEFGFKPIDSIQIVDADLGLEAVAYVLPEPASPANAGAHRLYLKRMFVTDRDVKVTPRWASFVRCVINSSRLRPTASRESLCEDEIFEATQRRIASRLSEYLHGLARRDRDKLALILSVHDEAIRQLAVEDEAFFKVVVDILPFETSCGTQRFGEYRAENTTVRLAPTLDQFRACGAIAAAQGITIFNGGYSNHTELLERAVALDPSLAIEIVDARALMDGLHATELSDKPGYTRLLAVADRALAPFNYRAVLKSFEPDDVAAVFAEGAEQSLARSIGASQARAEGFWKDVLQALHDEIDESECGTYLCLNTRSALVERLSRVEEQGILQNAVSVLYVQALLLGRQPLTDAETRMFADSLGEIIRTASDGAAS